MNKPDSINYLEIPSSNLASSKDFFTTLFNWEFTDYGPEYVAFKQAGIEGGFYFADVTVSQQSGSVLIVFYSDNLVQLQSRIEAAGGKITKPIFEFPGGRRFHFTEPCGNEYAAWSDQ